MKAFLRRMRRSHPPLPRSAWAVLVIVWSATVAPVGAADFLRIDLHEEAALTEGVVRIRDIGSISGNNSIAVARIGEVDVSALTPEKPEEVIGRDRITVRLLLAGYTGREVAITGARAVHVRVEEAAPDVVGFDAASVEQAARNALATTFSVEPDDVDARLATPVEITVDDTAGPASIDVLVPANARPGRMRLAIRVFSGGDLKQVTSGLFDVKLRQHVALASATLPVGTVLNASAVTYQDHWVTRRQPTLQPQALTQWRVRRPIRAGETITFEDLIPITREEEEPVVVHARDLVQLVARGKGIKATVPAAEALEDGRIGDTIRVRNMHSRRIVVGEVVSAEEVEVRF